MISLEEKCLHLETRLAKSLQSSSMKSKPIILNYSTLYSGDQNCLDVLKIFVIL